jgi:hypothetical protein
MWEGPLCPDSERLVKRQSRGTKAPPTLENFSAACDEQVAVKLSLCNNSATPLDAAARAVFARI